MIITISTNRPKAMELGYVFNKHPGRPQGYELSFGKAYVFYPVAREDECTIALLIDIDPVGLVRKHRRSESAPLEQYVNDRPYTNSSFMSVAISNVFTQALNGKCTLKPELAGEIFPLQAFLGSLPCRGGEPVLKKLFEPLGYRVDSSATLLDDNYPEWGQSPYYSVTLSKVTTVQELLKHLYVLIPVLDNRKHYYIDQAEIDKLLRHGSGWLEDHPEKELIAQRYLKHQPNYAEEALHRLLESSPEAEDAAPDNTPNKVETLFEERINLNEQRYGTIVSILKEKRAKTVIDVGCGEGRFMKHLGAHPEFVKVTGMDVSMKSLEIAKTRLRLDDAPTKTKDRFLLFHGSLMYRDSRLSGYNALTAIEVIEHLEEERLRTFQRVVFEWSGIPVIIVTTPNREYNTLWEGMQEGTLRHRDHRFEWTRREFRDWAARCAHTYGYTVTFVPIGVEHPLHGSPTQAAVFEKTSPATSTQGES